MRTVTVSAPYRIDLAGGWSDTSPMSEECGGVVLNVAVEIIGRPRLIARASPDLDWFGGYQDLKTAVRRVAKFSGDVQFESPFPEGTGLGISSILAACGVAACWKLQGREWTNAELAEAAAQVEREMGTDGGWQDQWGAIVPGAKLLTGRTASDVIAHPVACEGLAERLILADTGNSRLAADILHRVVGFYRDKATYPIWKGVFHGLQEGARDASEFTIAADWSELGRCLIETERLSETFTGACSEDEFAFLRNTCHGWKYCGAGGGGFMIALAHDVDGAKAALREHGLTVYNWRVADEGLRVEE